MRPKRRVMCGFRFGATLPVRLAHPTGGRCRFRLHTHSAPSERSRAGMLRTATSPKAATKISPANTAWTEK